MDILKGVRVLDCGTALAAPYAAMLLADLGAEVVKVEKPRRGDLMRFTDDYIRGESGYFVGANRGKRSIGLDLRKPEAQTVALNLAARSDILIENFRPGTMAGWGLSYEDVRMRNAAIIYCSISAFGSGSNFADRSGNDIVAQAYSGLMALTGAEDGPPAKAGAPVTDVAAGFLATIGMLAALLRRERTGAGAFVSTSLIEAAYALMPNFTSSVLNGSPKFRRVGSGHPQLAPYEAYATGDGRFVVLGVFHQESWVRLCAALGAPRLAVDEKFASNILRVRNRRELSDVIGGILRQQNLDVWERMLREHDVPFSPVLEIEESLRVFTAQDPGLLARDLPSNAGLISMLRAPFAIDGERPCHPAGAPVLGGSTDEVLAELGLTPAEIEELRQEGQI